MLQRAPVIEAFVAPPPLETPDDAHPQVQAAQILAASIDRAVDRFGPAADALSELSSAQKKLCNFLVSHRLKLAASVPAVLTFVGAMTPEAARRVHLLMVTLLGGA